MKSLKKRELSQTHIDKNGGDQLKLRRGQKFYTEKDLRTFIDKWMSKQSYKYSTVSAKKITPSIQAKRKNKIESILGYYQWTFQCILGKPRKTRGNKLRKKKSMKMGCTAGFNIVASLNGKYLEVREVNLTHNHDAPDGDFDGDSEESEGESKKVERREEKNQQEIDDSLISSSSVAQEYSDLLNEGVLYDDFQSGDLKNSTFVCESSEKKNNYEEMSEKERLKNNEEAIETSAIRHLSMSLDRMSIDDSKSSSRNISTVEKEKDREENDGDFAGAQRQTLIADLDGTQHVDLADVQLPPVERGVGRPKGRVYSAIGVPLEGKNGKVKRTELGRHTKEKVKQPNKEPLDKNPQKSMAFEKRLPEERGRILLKALLIPGLLDKAMKGYLIKVTDLAEQASSIPDIFKDEKVDLKDIESFLEPAAYNLLKKHVVIARKRQSFTCPICLLQSDLDVVSCDGYLRWFHFACVGLTEVPLDDEWFCSTCEGC